MRPFKTETESLRLANGTVLAYRHSPGRSPGVVFLGGFTSNMTGAKAMTLERWCQERGQAFVRFDYSGHGASSGRFAESTIGHWIEEALAVLDQLTSGPQILVGSSMGAWIMLQVAMARSERIMALLGLACAADFTGYLLWDRLDEHLRERLQRERVISLPSPYGEPYIIAMNLIEEAKQHMLLDLPELSIHCPVRFIHGMNDANVPWQTSVQVAEKLASNDVRLLLIKDGEHTLSREQDLMVLTRNLGELLDESA